jgi:hypothetical protein
MSGILSAMILSSGAVLPDVIGTASTYIDSANNSGTRTLSHATTSATKCLVVVVSFRSGSTVGSMSCTYNGVSMTMGPDVNTSTGSPNGRSTIYYLINPPVGTYNVVSTTTSNQIVSIVAINTTATSAGPFNSATSTTASVSDSVTTTGASLIIAGSEICNNTLPTSLTGTTIKAETGSTSFGIGVSYVTSNAGTTQTMTHTYGSDTTKKTIAVMAFY